METINAIAPLLNPDITNDEARAVVAAMTPDQKDIAILAFTQMFRDTMRKLGEGEEK